MNVRPKMTTRFNVLLAEDRVAALTPWTPHLSRLLEPHGVEAVLAQTGREAYGLASQREIHAAVIDLATPRDPDSRGDEPGGLWALEMFRRLSAPPPVVIVDSRPATPRQAHRFLNEALRRGAFSVVNRPVQLEAILAVIQRVVDRRYNGAWPGLRRG